jgi:hypothetical protein
MLSNTKYHFKEVISLINWYLNQRKKGVPIGKRKDEDYLDWYLNYRPPLKKYKNIHKGEDCFIVGNGPSLNKMDLELLNDYYVFGMNKIHLIFEKQKLKLSYHVAVNPLVIEQTLAEIEHQHYSCTSFISYLASKKFQFNNSVERLYTINGWTRNFLIDETIGDGGTVTFIALQLAFYMGFENIYLVGCDHNFQQKGKPNSMQKFEGDDTNHFHPDYFKGQNWHLADIEANEVSYMMAKYLFNSEERRILDCTIDGKLQIFDKLSFEQALSDAKKRLELRSQS